MLYQRLILLLPAHDATISSSWYIALVLAGLIFLVVGARIGQGIICLLCVTGGAIFGKLLPGLVAMKIDPMASTVACAFVAGVFGYLAYKWFTGLGLSLLTALWVTLGFWMAATSPAKWEWPELPDTFAEVLPWLQKLPELAGRDLSSQIAPFAAVSLLAALALYTLLPRVATALFWSMFGLTLSIFSLLAYTQYNNRNFAHWFPTTVQGQTVIVVLALGLGVLCQLVSRRRAAAEQPSAAAPAGSAVAA